MDTFVVQKVDRSDGRKHRVLPRARRPAAVQTEGTWERYSFTADNILFLMMGDRNDGGKELIARRWNVTFANCAAMTRYHGNKRLYPMTRLFTFTRGSNKVRIQSKWARS